MTQRENNCDYSELLEAAGGKEELWCWFIENDDDDGNGNRPVSHYTS